ncbi:pre-mRNA 3-end-processing factor fip1l1 [Coelomomyces lativittatus]|nr:pre-mRNA 3-end-processing factor fip1l1 [Coelomomyces lativittatus]
MVETLKILLKRKTTTKKWDIDIVLEPKSTSISENTIPQLITLKSTETKDTKSIVEEVLLSNVPKVDVNAVAQFEGKPITETSLDSLEEKPWRQPGADLTDYFNYGFTEETWQQYCEKQRSLREEFTSRKKYFGNILPSSQTPQPVQANNPAPLPTNRRQVGLPSAPLMHPPFSRPPPPTHVVPTPTPQFIPSKTAPQLASYAPQTQTSQPLPMNMRQPQLQHSTRMQQFPVPPASHQHRPPPQLLPTHTTSTMMHPNQGRQPPQHTMHLQQGGMNNLHHSSNVQFSRPPTILPPPPAPPKQLPQQKPQQAPPPPHTGTLPPGVRLRDPAFRGIPPPSHQPNQSHSSVPSQNQPPPLSSRPNVPSPSWFPMQGNAPPHPPFQPYNSNYRQGPPPRPPPPPHGQSYNAPPRYEHGNPEDNTKIKVFELPTDSSLGQAPPSTHTSNNNLPPSFSSISKEQSSSPSTHELDGTHSSIPHNIGSPKSVYEEKKDRKEKDAYRARDKERDQDRARDRDRERDRVEKDKVKDRRKRE